MPDKVNVYEVLCTGENLSKNKYLANDMLPDVAQLQGGQRLLQNVRCPELYASPYSVCAAALF